MKSKKATKRALLSSALSLVLCFSMLLGTTFAWFTDSASTGVNIIQSGTLKVDMVNEKETKSVKDGTFKTLDFLNRKDESQILWEPGCTFVSEGFKIVNKGNLALKYKLAITGINGDAELLDVIEFWLVESEPTSANWNTLPKFQLDKENNLDPNGKTLINGGKYQSELYYLVGHMDEDAGNEYQDKILDGVGITVYATQVEAEFDSFGKDYDADATYKPDYWSGIVPAAMPETLVIDFDTKTVTLNTAADFAYLDSLSANWNTIIGGAGGQYGKWNWTIALNTDIDLGGYPWTPMTIKGFKAFDGQNHTILNLNVEVDGDKVGLFAQIINEDSGATVVSNLTVQNATVSGGKQVGAVAGSAPQGVFENVTVKNAVVTGTKYVGGITGHSGTFTNCTVADSNITIPATVDGGKEAGGLAGYSANESHPTSVDKVISGNTVKNTTISAPTVASGLISQTSSYKGNIVFSNNKLENVTILTGDDTAALYVAAIYETDPYTLTLEDNNTATDCTTAVLETISSPAELTSVLGAAGAAGAGDSYISITEDLDMTDVDWTPISVDGYHGADVVTIYGNGATITGLTAPLFAGGFAGGSGIIIKDLTIADSNIVSTSGLGGGAFVDTADSMQVITLENCHLINSTVSGERTGGLIGWCSGYAKLDDGPVKAYVTISDCSVVDSTVTGAGSAGAIAGHPGASDYTYTTIEDCVVKNVKVISNDDSDWRTGAIVGTANNGHIVINNVTVEDVTLTQNGVTATETKLYGRFVPGTTGTLTIDGNEVISYDKEKLGGLYEYLPTLQSGDVLIMPAGTYTTSGTLTVPDGVTIRAAAGAEVIFRQNSDQQDNLFACAGDATFINIQFESNRKGYAIADNTKEHNTDGDITIIGCSFKGIATEKNWGVYKNLNGNLTVKNCSFDNYNNALCGINNGNGSKTVIEGCTFTNIDGEAIGYVTGTMPADFESEVIANNTGLTADNVIGY